MEEVEEEELTSVIRVPSDSVYVLVVVLDRVALAPSAHEPSPVAPVI